MKKSQHDSIGIDKQSPEKEKTAEQKAENLSEEACRCKEVSKKTPMELLKLMVKDLAIWKK